MNTALDFNTSDRPDAALTKRVAIGWEHTVEDADGIQQVQYVLDEAGEPVARTYVVPARLTSRQLLERTSGIDAATIEKLAQGDLEAILRVADELCGNGVIEAVGTDPTVPTDAFMRFVASLLNDLSGGQFGVSLGND